jgi:acyl-CoA synthetase (AMP-forming)/AMP-acid ligase II
MMKNSNDRIGYQPGETLRNNVISFLEDHVKNFPERVALRWVEPAALKSWSHDPHQPLPHQQITYGQFASLIRSTAKGLLDLGIKRGDRVIIFLPMGVGMYTAMFAVQRIGAIAVFLDSWARANHLGASAECVDPKAMISHKMAFDLVAQVPEFSKMRYRIIAGLGGQGAGKKAGFDADLEELMRTPGDGPIAPVESEYTALITFTTGSSGKPKGANRTHRFLAAQHEALSTVIPYTPEDKDMPAFPIFSLNNLASGVTTILPGLDLARPSEHDSAILASQILGEKLSCATLSPSMLNNLSAYCTAKGLKLPSLRRVVTGGAPISKDNVRDFAAVAPNALIWVLYGSTEVEPMAHIEAKEMLSLEQPADPEIVEEGVNVGHVDSTVRYKFIRIVDGPIEIRSEADWKVIELPRGQIGEFIVTGDHVCRDYYNNEDAFKSTKIRDLDGAIWHRTGDLAFMDEKGYLWMVGRCHNAIRRSDRYYFPVRAEVLLKRLPFCRQGAFLGMPAALPPDGMPAAQAGAERTAVALAVHDDAPIDKQAAIRELQRLFGKNKIPVDSVYFVDQIPMDPRHHSKVEYTILRDSILKTGVKDELKR